MAQTVRVVLRYLDGRHQPTSFASVSFTSQTLTGGYQVHSPRIQNGLPVVDVPAGEGTLQISAQLTPQSLSTFWTYQISSDGVLTKDKFNVDTRIRAQQLDAATNTYEIDVVDGNVANVDTATNSAFTSPSSSWSWNFPASTTQIVTDKIEREELIDFQTSGDVQPAVYVFALRHVARPKLLGVAVPKNLTNLEHILLFYHHTATQNASVYAGAPYPYSAPYIQYGLHAYFGGGRSMAYQLAAANKNLAMVLPVPDANGGDLEEIGKFDKDPVLVKSVLEELIAYFNRRFRNDFSTPLLKELVVGHYSGGILHTKALMKAPGPLAKLITEIYDIDGLYSSYGHGLNASSFAAPGRVIRTYQQIGVDTPKNFAALANQNLYAINFDRWKKYPPPPHLDRLTNPKDAAKDLALNRARKDWVHGQAPAGLLYHALSKRKA